MLPRSPTGRLLAGLLSLALVTTTACGQHRPPTTAPAPAWLVTTHSGDDVLTVSADGHVGVLVGPNAGGLDGARGIVVGPGGDLFVATSKKGHGAVLRFARDGTFKGRFATGTADRMVRPYGLAFDAAGDLYVSAQDDDAVSRFDGKTGAFRDTFVPAGTGGLKTVRGITFMPGGDLLVASRDTHEVLRYDGRTGAARGAFVTRHSGGLSKPIQVHYGPDGNLYVGSSGTGAVLRYDGRTGASRGTFAAGGGLDVPSGFAWSAADGDLYVEGRLSNQLLRFDGRTGAFRAVVAHGGQVDQPEFLLPWPKWK